MKTKNLQFNRLKNKLFKVSLVLACTTVSMVAQNQLISPTEAANNFTVFISGDAIAMGTESEGSWAVGGNLTIDGTFNIFGGLNYFNDDTQPTALVVNQQVNYVTGGLHILENNFIKIGDLSTSAIFNLDNNNTPINTRITYTGGNFNSNPKIELSTNQAMSSISGDTQIDFVGAFSQFMSISDVIGSQDTNVTWNENEFNTGKLWVNLIPNQTNVINLTVAEFNGLNEIKFITEVPSTTTPFIINITDSSDTPEVVTINSWPNIVGSPLEYAAYILYNFPNVTSTIDYTGGAQIYGTIYAPRARFNNRSNSNIDGQIITEVLEQNSGEIHAYPFDAIIEVEDPLPSEEICDGIDNNNDGVIDEGFADTDQDGIADCIDNCPLIANPDQADADGNGIGDVCDPDFSEEICDGIDNDNDGLVDEGFADTDEDGIADCIDNCPLIANPDQADADDNGIGDVCDSDFSEEICDGLDNDNDGLVDEGFADTDEDGIADCIDNCPLVANSDQADADGNGIGDVCDPDFSEEICDGIDNDNDGLVDEGFVDTDEDGIADCIDNCPLVANPDQADADDNGIGDVCDSDFSEETCDGLDNDNDGLVDEGFADTDEDGIADCIDNCPLVANSDQADADGNGIGDVCESISSEEVCDGIDNDNDGLIDEGFEDTDHDGIADCVDNCPYTPNPDQTDSDNDGIGDDCVGNPTRVSLLNLDIYPVPFHGVVNIKFATPFDTTAKIEIFDVRGTLIKSITNLVTKASKKYVIPVDLTGTENQMLFISLTTSNGTIVKQVLSN
ncbi:collagen-binding domain-containing protein [Olleya sp. Bg11-27]|uniref:collagen-binding domain-containing protein n=1 Tax=Olleya sp. Bg11-27 TaxID=2058135 RepID=UPI000C30151F|nr:collagen-binding domain-containing protein [Olleya sp. Bg11-27]AUC76488.1 hypothetical protein CW732_12745 [Olleya sp. Bg11-27]